MREYEMISSFDIGSHPQLFIYAEHDDGNYVNDFQYIQEQNA